MSQRHRNEQYAEIAAAIALLAEAFPKAFSIFEQRRRPLKIGIRGDLLARLGGTLTEIELRQVLRAYTANGAYRRRLLAGAPRIDLDGNPVGTVSAEEAADALAKIAAKTAKVAARKQSAQPEQPKKRDGLAQLRAAAQRRKEAAAAS
jgi:ProP effector